MKLNLFHRKRRRLSLYVLIFSFSLDLMALMPAVSLSVETDHSGTIVWHGCRSSEWRDSANWDPAGVPNGSEYILISAGCCRFPQLRSDDGQVVIAETGVLFLERGSALTLRRGGCLKLEPGATVITEPGAKILLEAGSLYQNHSLSAPLLDVRAVLDGSRGWRTVASPVATTYGAMFRPPLVTQGFSGSDFPRLAPNLYWWDESHGGTTLQGWVSPVDSSEVIPPGRGHFFYLFDGAERLTSDGNLSGKRYGDMLPCTLSVTGHEPVSPTGVFTFSELSYTARDGDAGDPFHQGDRSVEHNPLDAGWNLVGNPTPGTLYWFNDEGWERKNIDKTLYMWDPDASEGQGAYQVWNGIAGHTSLSDGAIPPFQSFWIHATGPPLLRCSNRAKSSVSPVTPKNGGTEESVVLPVWVKCNNRESRIFITWSSAGKKGHDPFDAYALEPPHGQQLLVGTAGGEGAGYLLTINNFPVRDPQAFIPLFIENRMDGADLAAEINLCWKVPENWPADLNLVLLDYQEKTAVSMLDQPNYRLKQHDISFFPRNPLEPLTLPALPMHTHQVRLSVKSTGGNRFAILVDHSDRDGKPQFRDSVITFDRSFPNPFDEKITLMFSLPEAALVTLEVLRADGTLVDTPLHEICCGGFHEIEWKPTMAGAGIYFFRLISGAHIMTKMAVRAGSLSGKSR